MTNNISPSKKRIVATQEDIQDLEDFLTAYPEHAEEAETRMRELNPKILPKGYPFWDKGSKPEIRARKLIEFLESQGFGKLQTVESRTSRTELFKEDDGVLQLHNASSLRSWLIDYVEKSGQDIDQADIISAVLDKLVKLTPNSLDTWCQSLPSWSETGHTETKKLNLFNDDKNNCYIPFKNGVVHITKNTIELLDKDVLKSKGCIWESKIISKTIGIDKEFHASGSCNQGNTFKDFIHYALKDNVEPQRPSNGGINYYTEGTEDPLYSGRKDAFETAFGYLIHSYNPPDEGKIVVFIDVDSSPERTDGGNGKSLAMEMVKYYRKTTFVDGKAFRKGMNDSSRFNFSNVQVDTGFININDINPDFDLTQIFSLVTDDMTIEGKGTNKIVIPRDKKPKMGISTNYVVTGVGTSFDRRQHIVEFGNFWSKCVQLNIKPQEILGQMIGREDFTEKDWIDFYNYGFYCVQKYLNNGLIAQPNANYKRKTLIASIEGVTGTGEVTEWIEDYCLEGRKEHPNGVTTSELFRLFVMSVPPNIILEWDTPRLLSSMFDYVKIQDHLEWNPKFAHKGNTRSDRRDRRGAMGDQKEYVTIADKKGGKK